MKKNIFAFLFALLSILPAVSFGEIMLPRTVSIGDASTYDAGSVQSLTFVNSGRTIGNQRELEYGVVRTIKTDNITSYEIISSDTMNLANVSTHPAVSIKIPNLTKENATGTYAVFVKYFEKNNPENENFYASKEFSIKTNNTPFIYVKNVSLLQSNGKRFSTTEGPSIYNVEDAQKYSQYKVATSTSLEITFESNQDTVLDAKVLFSKIRSDAFGEEFVPTPITVKKGITYVVIPLPVFNYEPGVYMGEVSFNSALIKNKVDIQYIIAGDSVSIGTILAEQAKGETNVNFKIFSAPTDLDLASQASSTLASTTIGTYLVRLDFVNDKGSIVYSAEQNVDFSGQDFDVKIPNKIFKPVNIAEVIISVISPTTGKVVYESTRLVEYASDSKTKSTTSVNSILYILLYVILITITIVAILKRKIALIIVAVCLLVGLFFTRELFAGYVKINAPFLNTSSQQKLLNEYVDLYIQDDERGINSGVTYACNENIQITYKINFLRCSNHPTGVTFGISTVSAADAKDKITTIVNAGGGNVSQHTGGAANTGAQEDTSFARIYDNVDKSHFWYKNMSDQRTVSVPQVAANNSNRYIFTSAYHYHTTGGYSIGMSDYTFPITNSCGISTCACSGRTQVCTVDGIESSRTPNSPSCSLQASCAASLSGTNASFNIIATNARGAISYKDTDTGLAITNPYTKEGRRGTTVVQKTTITDAFDGMTATSVCSVDISMTPPNEPPTAVCTPGTLGCTGSGTVCVPGTPGCTDVVKKIPTLKLFETVKNPVRKGGLCEYKWISKDADRCSMTINNESVSLLNPTTAGIISSKTIDGNNQKAVITCVSDNSPTTVSSTTVCQVLPEVIER